jgi:hypothetical protein
VIFDTDIPGVGGGRTNFESERDESSEAPVSPPSPEWVVVEMTVTVGGALSDAFWLEHATAARNTPTAPIRLITG